MTEVRTAPRPFAAVLAAMPLKVFAALIRCWRNAGCAGNCRQGRSACDCPLRNEKECKR